MKYGLLSYFYSNNIGDEIQSIAAERFLPRIDMEVERDRLHWYKRCGPLRVIFNGWFTRPAFPSCWPPPENILPVFTSFHAVTPHILINAATVDYFKMFEPIGCRDLPTLEHFERFGITAYHSGCLTLTLPECRDERTDNIYIVDVDSHLLNSVVPPEIVSKAKNITHMTPTGDIDSITGWSAFDFYLKVWNRIDRNMTFIQSHRKKMLRMRHIQRMRMARQRLATYSNAKLVITGLLHCAMPCLALGTPVVLLKPDLDTNPRFSGLKELVRYRSSGSKINIDWAHPEPNSDEYKSFAKALIEECSAGVILSRS